MSCKPTYKGVRYNSLEELYKANGVNTQQAQQLYSSYLQTTNNPTIEGFKQWNNRQQEINELFESNPELANEVYEALGFKIKNEKWDILSNSIGKVIEIETNDGDYYKAKITSIKKRNNDSIFLKAKTAKGKEYSYLIDLQGQPIGNNQHFEWINTGDIWKADYEYDLTSQQEQKAQQLYSEYLESLNKPNTNPVLQSNQQEQVKKVC